MSVQFAVPEEAAVVSHDPIELQVVRQRLVAIPNLIEKNVERTAFSLLVQEYKDFAIGFVDPKGHLVTQSRYSLPGFVANALGLGVREALKVFGGANLHEGDVVLVNGYVIGKHLNDVVALTPVRCDGDLIGFFAVLVHWIDVGGRVVGSCLSPDATDIWQEGLQLSTVKLMSRGQRVDDIYRIVLANSRFPDLLAGDLQAQLGGCFMGRDMVHEVIADHGVHAVKAAISEMQDDASVASARAIAELPKGVFKASSFLDDDGINLGVRLAVEAVVTLDERGLTIDLSGLNEQVLGPINLSFDGGAVTFARVAAKVLLAPGTPVNEADFDHVHVIAPVGTFMSARPGAAMGQGGFNGPTIVDTIFRALAAALPDRIPAGHHGTFGIHQITGTNRFGEPFLSLDAMSGGWGAFSKADGPNALRSITHGDVRDVPVEIQEALYPYRIEAKRLVQDSGGAGRHRGGLGVEKIYAFPSTKRLRCNITVERTECAPWGVADGQNGATPFVELRSADGTRRLLRKSDVELNQGDVLRVVSGGGGGYGAGYFRDVESVLADVRDGYVSQESALRDYGVILNEQGDIDQPATAVMRDKLLSGA
ncbi:hydantoinase B/oxoprolinase family protein [Bradyrhizobium sp. AUGA SZCCT0182]|uniref:hydantoinase B/oxoprolinase family protein n=1 Tax=Bradyrhizobium sp. AUGA SZCCT0182 TaxID=2807667 RepID=UPI001BA87DA6|nr:hydantoinase B/oxoprolinase family protein [Bradyrhizobium sp. AUGA SZCCT0182]MBR1231797.1 hydantoinase B/oxoprolinase family protein [Bradyrhizobium sp. AUGA SZCCT0182]